MSDSSGRAESTVLAEVALLAGRAGLELSAAEVAEMVEPYQRTQAALAALRRVLGETEEPAITFRPGRGGEPGAGAGR